MFGDHKGHNYLQEVEFYKNAEVFTKKMGKKIKKIESTEELIRTEFLD